MIGRRLFELTHRLRGSQALERLADIRHEGKRPPEEVQARQWARVQRLLLHAEARVPYYREMLANLGIAARDIRTRSDFAQLPILTKDIVRANRDALVAEGFERSALVVHRSGGSTGVPLEFFHSKEALDLSEAGMYRNFLQAGWQPGEMVAFFWGFTPAVRNMSRPEFELRQCIRRSYQFDSFRQGPEDLAGWVRTLHRIRPSVVFGYTSSIALFAEWALQEGKRLPPVKGVFCTAEKLFPRQREAIERAFDARVYDMYGSSEVRNIACECSFGSYHLNSDFVYAEVADPTRQEPQNLLLTGLTDESMPFIRYQNEDCGTLFPITCECGSGFPAVRLDIARTFDEFRLSNGRVVHGLFFTHLFYGVNSARMFQFRQVDHDLIELDVVPDAAADGLQTTLDEIRSKVESLNPGRLRCVARLVESVPLSRAGKHRFTISMLDGSAQRGTTRGDVPPSR